MAEPSSDGWRYGDPSAWDSQNTPLIIGSDATESQENTMAWDPRHQLENIQLSFDGELELPVVGATGYTSVELTLWGELPTENEGKLSTMQTQTNKSTAVAELSPGTAFIILEESGDWWWVRTEESAGSRNGWIEHRYCFINLPDVIPSMIYNNTNAYSSVFRTSGKDIPGITDNPLYNAKSYNPRLGKDQFLMPVLYAMAKKICQAQHNALAEGNTLVLIEGFQPQDTQITVANAVNKLASQDADVRRGISTSPWNISWFIASEVSNHQQGYAIDVTLAKVTDAEIQTINGHNVVNINAYEYYTMPSPIHELSMAAATYTEPVAILSQTAWQSATMSAAMAANEPAKALQRYCTDAGMTPLASEWWQFNDLDAYSQVADFMSIGNFFIESCCSLPEEIVAY